MAMISISNLSSTSEDYITDLSEKELDVRGGIVWLVAAAVAAAIVLYSTDAR